MSLTKLQLSEMLSVYGAILTDRQRDVAAMYCDCDCGLSEIADEMNISRQAVRDAVVKSEATMIRLENALHIVEYVTKMQSALDNDDMELLKTYAKRFVSKE